MKYIISILFLLISVSSYGQRISELSTTTDGRDGRVPIIRPSGSPSGWTTFAISYDNLVQYLETDIADNLSRIGEISDSLTIAYDTVFDAWTAIVEIKTRNNNQTDSLKALYDTAAVHLDTLQLHASQISSILSDLDTKLEVTDTINHATRSDTTRILELPDGKVVDDSTDLGSDSAVYADKSGELRTDQMDLQGILTATGTTATTDPVFTYGSNLLVVPRINLVAGSSGTLTFDNEDISGFNSQLYYRANQHRFFTGGVNTVRMYTDSVNISHLLSVTSGGLRLPDGYLIASEGDLSTGGTSDSSSVTYSLDTAKALNNDNVYFNSDINFDQGARITLDANTGDDDYIESNTIRLNLNHANNVRFTTAETNWIQWTGTVLRTNGNDTAAYLSDLDTLNGLVVDDSLTITGSVKGVTNTESFATTKTVDFSTQHDVEYTITGGTTITIAGVNDGSNPKLALQQDATGGHSVTISGATEAANTNTIPTAANSECVLQFEESFGKVYYFVTILKE